MATNKPQFNVRLDPAAYTAIDSYATSSGIPRGRLVERMWERFQLTSHIAIQEVCDHLEAFVVRGVPQRDSAPLYKLMLALQRAFKDQLQEGK
jgi:hypothetical protein